MAETPRPSASLPGDSHRDEVEQLQLSPGSLALYRDREYWKEETTLSKVEDWTVPELARWIRSSIRRADSVCRYTDLVDRPHKYVDLVEKLLHVMEQEDIGGGLLLAGGKSYLTEKASFATSSKRDRTRLPHAVTLIFAAVEEATDLHGAIPYWERVWRGSPAGHALCGEFEASEGIGRRLRRALEPRPLKDVKYEALRHLEVANDVVEADLYVRKEILEDEGQCLFKVVSVAPRDDPTVVWSNLIYVRNDLDSLDDRKPADSDEGTGIASVSRGKQRRKQRQQKRQRHWELVASVDFAQHGSASPGHWHLNRTSCGDLIPHLSVGISGGEAGGTEDEVWHGREDCCPLWWQFVPDGMLCKSDPQRLKLLLDEAEKIEFDD